MPTCHLSRSGYTLLERRKPSYGPPVSGRGFLRPVPRYYFRWLTTVYGPMGSGASALRGVVPRLQRRAAALRRPAVRFVLSFRR